MSANPSSALRWSGAERRRGRDRRKKSAWHRAALSLSGQRLHARRVADRQNYYVDRYPTRWLLVSVSIMVLCCLDAFLTLMLIHRGIAEEANPFMRYFLEDDVLTFMVVKYLFTTFGIVVLLAHKNFVLFQYVKVGHVLYGFLAMYVALIHYELWMFSLA